MDLKDRIEELWLKTSFDSSDREVFDQFKKLLQSGEVRAATPSGRNWIVNKWVKKGILIGFRMGQIVKMSWSENKVFYDKDTFPERSFEPDYGIRMVVGGSSVREGAFVARDVIMMPPMYINVGAYIDSGCMIDSHALVGTCAQVGKDVHLSAASQLGGVLEPITANPVIIEDGVFIGGNCGIYEGVIVGEKAIIAAGVVITSSTVIYDSVNELLIRKPENGPLRIPENSVTVPGVRPLRSNPNYSISCPIIIKYRDEKSDSSVVFEQELR